MMKNLILSAFKSTIVLLIVLFLSAGDSAAQTPQFYNYNNGTSYNSFPLNVAAGKMVQTLIAAGEFNQPGPAIAGNITKFYLRISTGYPLGPATYTNFRILFSQAAITVLPTGSFYPGPWDTVYQRASVTMSAAADTWLQITLDHPYTFNPAQGLIVQIEQCGASGTTTGYCIQQTSTTGVGRRSYSAGACPYAYAGLTTSVINCGVDVATVPIYSLPDLIYYKFMNNTPGFTPNFAIPGVGSNPAPLTGTGLVFAPSGQFDSCISGTGTASSHVNTNWQTNFGAGSWTISMWLNNLPTNTTVYYMFEEATGGFRSFIGGAAGSGNILLRGTGLTDVIIPSITPGPTVVHFVYDSASATIKGYKNGVFALNVPQAVPLNLATGTNFQVAGYSSLVGLNGQMDEFRIYRRALSQAEITATWNQNLGVVTGVTPVSNEVPENYKLSQNYPNPFNSMCNVQFSMCNAGNVKLVVYNVLGREVQTLINERLNGGTYEKLFDASMLPSGVYFYRLEVNGFTDTKKMSLIK
jgi:hypothetical protein